MEAPIGSIKTNKPENIEETPFYAAMVKLSNFARTRKVLGKLPKLFIKLNIQADLWEALLPKEDEYIVTINPEQDTSDDLPYQMLLEKRPHHEIIEAIKPMYQSVIDEMDFIAGFQGSYTEGLDLHSLVQKVDQLCRKGFPILFTDLVCEEIITESMAMPSTQIMALNFTDAINNYIIAYIRYAGRKSIKQAITNIVEGFQIPADLPPFRNSFMECVIDAISEESILSILDLSVPFMADINDSEHIMRYLEKSNAIEIDSIKTFLLNQSRLGNGEAVLQVLRFLVTKFKLLGKTNLLLTIMDIFLKLRESEGEISSARYTEYVHEIFDLISYKDEYIKNLVQTGKSKIILKLYKISRDVGYTKFRKDLLNSIYNREGYLYGNIMSYVGCILLAEEESLQIALEKKYLDSRDVDENLFTTYGYASYYDYCRLFWEDIDFSKDILEIQKSNALVQTYIYEESFIAKVAEILAEVYIENRQFDKLADIINSPFCDERVCYEVLSVIAKNAAVWGV